MWMRDKGEFSVACDILEQHNVKHCNDDNNYNDDNMMHASMWFEFFDDSL